jgi:hypothetical protein
VRRLDCLDYDVGKLEGFALERPAARVAMALIQVAKRTRMRVSYYDG